MLTFFGALECLRDLPSDPSGMRALSQAELDAMARRNAELMRPCSEEQRQRHEAGLVNASPYLDRK